MVIKWFSGSLCSPVVSGAREGVTSAVNLVAVLGPVSLEVSSDQLIVDFVAELVSGILYQLLFVEKSGTVVAPPPIIRSLVISRSCNRQIGADLLEIYSKEAVRWSCAGLEGQIGRKIECFPGINFKFVEACLFLRRDWGLIDPKEVLDDLFAVEDVKLRAEGVRGALLAVHSALKVLKLLHDRAKEFQFCLIGGLLLGLKALNLI